jgi:hypothetical protein
MSIFRSLDRSIQYQTNGFRLRSSGILKSWPAAPLYVGIGTGGSNAGATTIGWATDANQGDLGVLVIESSGADATSTPSGWTHFQGSPVVDIADATGSKLNVLWKFAESNAPSPASLADAGDHVIARMAVFRNVSTIPGRITATNTKTTASTSVTWPSITTPSPNNMVVFVASRPDDNGSSSVFSAFTAAGLTGPAEAGEGASTVGDGGGFVICYGTRAAMGSIGTSTATMNVSVTNALFVVSLEPTVALPA